MRSYGPKRRAALTAIVLASLTLAHASGLPGLLFSQVPDQPDPGGEPVQGTAPAPGIPGLYASLGLNLAVAVPFGEFARNVGSGYGITGDLSFRLLRDGWLGLRLDGGAIWYGSETLRETVYISRVPLDIESTTRNYIAYGAIGPQLHFGGHPMSARLYGLLGLSYFETRTSAKFDIEDPDIPQIDLGSHGHVSDWTPSYAIGGELRWVITGNRDGELLGLGLNIDWRHHGTTRYLVEGSITDVDGRAVFETLKSRADFLLISLGVWFGTW
jgi:hypothetical protein